MKLINGSLRESCQFLSNLKLIKCSSIVGGGGGDRGGGGVILVGMTLLFSG